MSVVPLPVEERDALRDLIESRRAGDALAAYYALYHPPAKTRIWIHRSSAGRQDGFLVLAQTGLDLFRPLIALRATDSSSAVDLFRAALPPGRPFLCFLPEGSALWVRPLLRVETQQRLLLYRLAPAKFTPVLNIFVTRSASPDGLARFEIRREDEVSAAAGINWQSPDWAEIFVQTDPRSRRRGYAKSVCAALCAHLLDTRRSVLFAVEERNRASIRLAESIGFEDTGERELQLSGSFVGEIP